MKGRNSVKDICLFQSICILIKLHCSPKFHMIRHFSEMEIRYEYALWGDWLWDHKFGSVKKNIFLLYILTQRCLSLKVTVEVQYFYNCEKLQELIF